MSGPEKIEPRLRVYFLDSNSVAIFNARVAASKRCTESVSSRSTTVSLPTRIASFTDGSTIVAYPLFSSEA